MKNLWLFYEQICQLQKYIFMILILGEAIFMGNIDFRSISLRNHHKKFSFNNKGSFIKTDWLNLVSSYKFTPKKECDYLLPNRYYMYTDILTHIYILSLRKTTKLVK